MQASGDKVPEKRSARHPVLAVELRKVPVPVVFVDIDRMVDCAAIYAATVEQQVSS